MAKKATPAAPKVPALALRNVSVKTLIEIISVVRKNPDSPQETSVPLALHGPLARARNVVARALEPVADALEARRIALVNQHAEKGDDGAPKTNEETGRFEIPESERPALEAAYAALLEEESAIPVPNVDKPHWRLVRDYVVRDCRSEFTPMTGAVYADLCDRLEALAL